MFGRKQRRHTVVDTLVGANTKVNGDVHFKGGCHVDGIVKGNVTADNESDSALSISEDGWKTDEDGLRGSHENCGGWTHMAMCLKGWIEHDIDMRWE